jgi:hypothetical protein
MRSPVAPVMADDGVRAQQRRDALRDGAEGRRFHREHDDIEWSKLRGVFACPHGGGDGRLRHPQPKAVTLQGLQGGAARDGAHRASGGAEARTDEAADRAHSVHADGLHVPTVPSGPVFRRRQVINRHG